MTLRDRVHQTSPHVSGKAYLAEHGRGSIAQRIAESDCHWADGGKDIRLSPPYLISEKNDLFGTF
jgi:hypothetical protein